MWYNYYYYYYYYYCYYYYCLARLISGIDAAQHGSRARFVNHACNGNTSMRQWLACRSAGGADWLNDEILRFFLSVVNSNKKQSRIDNSNSTAIDNSNNSSNDNSNSSNNSKHTATTTASVTTSTTTTTEFHFPGKRIWQPVLLLFSERLIQAGEEITFTYSNVTW